jgi:hypothetical protein
MFYGRNCFQEIYSDNMTLISKYRTISVTAQALESHSLCPRRQSCASAYCSGQLTYTYVTAVSVLDSWFQHLVLNIIITLY